jgi:2-polyprenyl-6-methoxyphenol hydroxylase-like FAD-dependent oxidoreductase
MTGRGSATVASGAGIAGLSLAHELVRSGWEVTLAERAPGLGADGIHSSVLRHLQGAEAQCLRYLELHTAAYTFTDPAVHAALAGRFVMTDTVGRTMGLYGLREHRVALLGDACQAVSLLAGQGASPAVAGACVLAGHLAGHLATAGSVPTALQRYEERWRPVVLAAQQAGRRDAEWFLPLSDARRRKRRLMLHLMALPGLNRLIAQGLVGRTRTPR